MSTIKNEGELYENIFPCPGLNPGLAGESSKSYRLIYPENVDFIHCVHWNVVNVQYFKWKTFSHARDCTRTSRFRAKYPSYWTTWVTSLNSNNVFFFKLLLMKFKIPIYRFKCFINFIFISSFPSSMLRQKILSYFIRKVKYVVKTNYKMLTMGKKTMNIHDSNQTKQKHQQTLGW